MAEQQKKRALFIGMTDYDLSKESAVLEKKFGGLSRDVEVYVLGRGRGWHTEKYGAHFYLIPRLFGKLGVPLWFVCALFRGFRIIMSKKIDVIVTQSPIVEGVIGAILKTFTRRELVVETHGDWINSYFYYFDIPFESFFKKILTKIGAFSLRRADKVRAISAYTESMVRRYAPDARIYRFAAFMNIDEFRDETTISCERTIVFAGVLYRLKGVQFLIEAFGRIRKDLPDRRLIVIGDGPYRAELEKLAHGDPAIEFAGMKRLSELKDIVKRCEVFVLPSLSEGLGRVLIEAGMLGKPLIGSDTGGIPDLIENGVNGYLFEPGNAADLEDKLRMILNDPDGARRMGEQSRKKMNALFSDNAYFTAYRDMFLDTR